MGGPPSIAATLLVTFFFGLFGLIPAVRHSRRARERGYPESKYWWAFGGAMATSVVLAVAIPVVFLVILAHAVNTYNASTYTPPSAGSSRSNYSYGSSGSSGSSASSGSSGYSVSANAAIHSSPDLSSSTVGTVYAGTSVSITCTAEGSPVTDSVGRVTSLWDYIDSPSPGGYIPDAYVNTGTSSAEAGTCANASTTTTTETPSTTIPPVSGNFSMIKGSSVYSSPDPSSSVVGQVGAGDSVSISCTAQGPEVSDENGSSTLWDYITNVSPPGYVSDEIVRTGTSSAVAPNCPGY